MNKKHDIYKLIALIRESYRNLSRIVPERELLSSCNLHKYKEKINKSDASKLSFAISEVEKSQYLSIIEGEYIWKLKHAHLEFLQEKIMPNMENLRDTNLRIEGLTLDTMLGDLSDESLEYKKEEKQYDLNESTKERKVDSTKLFFQDRIEEISDAFPEDDPPTEFEIASDIANSEFFKPEEWYGRANDIRPINLKKDFSDPGLNHRVDDLFESFLFGNFYSCIAMSRALIEYCVSQKKDRLNVTLYENTSLLGQAAKCTKKDHPYLSNKIYYVKEEGNKILHSSNGIAFLEGRKGEEHALDVLKEAQEAAEYIFCI